MHKTTRLAIHTFYTYYPISQEVKAIKYGQLIEYKIRNIFLEKLHAKCGGGTIPRPF